MALQAEIIPFTFPTPAGAATFTVNHVRYPSIAAKALMFICASNTGTNSEIYAYGVDDGATHIGTGVGMTETFGVSLSARGYSTEYSLVPTQAQAFFGGAQIMAKGYVSAINIGSFDITLDLNNTPGAAWFAVMIAGSDVQAKVGLYDVSGGSGTATVGFDPVAIFKLSCPDAATTGQNSGAFHTYGFATPCGTDEVAWGISCGSITSASTSFQLDGKIQADIANTSTIVSNEVTVSSYPANGFGLTVSGAPTWNIGYLALGGADVSANLVEITQPISTGVQNTTIAATNPVIAFFASTDKVATSPDGVVDANLSFGVYDGVSNMSQWWGTINNAAANYKRDRLSSTTKAITMATATGVSTSTVNAEASCTLASTNIALNWTTVDATQRSVWAFVLAQNLTGGSNVCGANPQASLTVFKQCTPISGGATAFPFGATGGLSPTTFTLQDGETQLFSAISPGTYGITESAPTGWTASYAVSTGDPHTAIVVGSGEAVTVTVTNTFGSTEETLLRLRRWALPYDGNKQIFIPRIEIISQMGVGNADDPAPVMYLRISPDGGSNFGPWRQMPLGASGDTEIRSYLTRFGQLRNPVCELVCEAPVFVAWVRCELPQGFSVGSS